MKYSNPIIKGYNPDPSICRVGNDYYLVTSTFEFFPGVPIYHSTDLINWELITYCLTRDSQLNLEGCRASGGIFAPTLRYNNGRFYMITTNVTHKGNFIVYADNIMGPWSEPLWIDHKGIDPSLLFDEDGKVYFCGTGNHDGIQAIFGFEIDPNTGAQLTEPVIISYGAGGKYPEAPHMYKIRGKYYLLLAEGGTEYGHKVTFFRSESPYGPYEPCPGNPILSHRDYMNASIQATGHADIVEDNLGNWWMVCLAIRPLPNRMLHNLGRETFLAPMKWDEGGWPVVGNNGKIDLLMDGPLPNLASQTDSISDLQLISGKTLGSNFRDGFSEENFDLEWGYVRNLVKANYQKLDNACLLKGDLNTLSDLNPTAMLIRQKEFHSESETRLRIISNSSSGEAGITAYYNYSNFYSLGLRRHRNSLKLVMTRSIHDIVSKHEIDLPHVPDDYLVLKIVSDTDNYSFYYQSISDEAPAWILVGSASVAGLCTEGTSTMTFTGAWTGIYASAADAEFSYFNVDSTSEKSKA